MHSCAALAQRQQCSHLPYWAKLRPRATGARFPEYSLMHLKKSLIALLTTLGLASGAHASSLVATTDTLLGAAAGTVDSLSDATSSLRDAKVVRAARDDAASFVASAGSLRGARLEAALQVLRPRHPDASDAQLAEAILARPGS